MSMLIRKATVVLLSSAALFTAGGWIGHRLTREHYQGVIARQALRFAAERQKLSAEVIKAERRNITQERQKEAELVRIDYQHQQELQHAKAQNRRTLAELESARRLYIGIRPAACSRGRLPATAAASSLDYGEARAELSEQAARFLVQLAFDADQVVRQLTACQKVVRADRVMG